MTRSGARLLASMVLAVLVLAGLVLAGPAPAAGADPDPFEACSQIQAPGEDWNACGCFFTVAMEHGRLEDAERRLRLLAEAEPEWPCVPFNLGRLALRLGRGDALALLNRAAEAFAAQGEAEGETWARLNASRAARRAGDGDEAARQLEAARLAASRAQGATLQAQLELQTIRLELVYGGDLEQIGGRLAALEASAQGIESTSLWRDLLQARGNTAYLLGRFDEAASFYRRMAEHCRRQGDRYGEATARLNRVIAKSASDLRPEERGLLRSWLEETLDVAVEAGQLEAEAEARLRLAMVARTAASNHDVVPELERSIELARRLDAVAVEARALAALAVATLDEHPLRARELAKASDELARRSPYYGSSSFGWSDRLEVAWRTSSLEQATVAGFAMLDAAEAYRRQQRASGERAEAFAAWAEIFYSLSGRLMAAAAERGGADRRRVFEQAFGVMERLRARVLLESLGADVDAGVVTEAGVGVEVATGVDASDTFEAASLERIQAALDGRTALLSLQVAPWQSVYGDVGGGSWLSVVTAGDVGIYRLPGRPELASAVRIFGKLVEKRDGSDAAAARRLHSDLIEEALADLPPGVDHLVLVADGPLYRLPFSRLLDGDGEPLMRRFSLSWTPSATFWTRLLQRRPAAAGAALILADPAPAEGARLPPLPAAREEAKRVKRTYAGRIVQGEEASEQTLGDIGLERFNVLHVAAHAVVDWRRPERSFLALAAGAGHDGRLSSPEIARLELDGRLVVLAACRGAGGRILAGEGPMSLSRAFFQAGASTVVANLWPLRDDESARLFEDFYDGLARGRDVASSLARAQDLSRRRGDPAAAWAGLVVLGDGAATFEPRLPPLERWILRILSALVVTAMLLAAGSLLWLYARSSAGFESPWSGKAHKR